MSGLRFGVLGPLEVRRDGAPVVVNGEKLRVLLAALLVEANTTVSIDRLAERLWGERLPRSARKNIQLHALRLRRTLGEGHIETQPTGYLLRVRPEDLDVLRFHELTEAARDAERTGDQVTELALLTTALGCWRGPALADIPSASLQSGEAARLGEEWLRTRERVIQLSLDLGRHREIIGELFELVREHPWQETFWAQLIVALHRAGRRADALDTYRDAYRMFADELGVQPGAEIQQAHLLALADDPSATGREPAPPPTSICQLPADVHRFIGRERPVAEIAALPDRPDRRPIVVFTGPPGVGKTALAVHVARLIGAKFPDGQLYVDLQGFALDPPLDPSAALTRLLTALGIPRDSIPSEVQAQAALFRSTVSDRSMLLLLDNAIDVEQVRPLLPGHPGCVVLITSRNDLRGLAVHPGADQVPVDVLSEAESAAVLTDLLGADRAAAEPEALADLARTCAHLPLALRIAGANLAADPGRGIAEYTAEIATSGRLTELAVGGDERSAVRIAFDLSYVRLTAADQRLFRLLGLVPGADVGVPAAAALVGAVPAEARRALDRLVAANLLQRPRPGRYRFHDLIREYAVECAAADETADDRVVRVVDVLVQTATAASQLLYRLQGEAVPDALPLTTEAIALQWLDEEWLNLLAVMRWAAVRPAVCRQAWRLAEALRGYFDTRGAAAEALAACTAALHAASASGDRSAEASLLALLGTIEYNLGRYDRAIGYRVDVLRTVRDLGDTAAEADALCSVGRAQWRNGQPAAALRACREAMDVSRAAGHTDVEIEAMTVTGTVHLFRGEPLAALEWYERALALASTTGNREAVHRALHGRGNAREALGRVDEAIVDHQQVLNYCRASGRGFGETASLLNLAEAEMDSGRPTAAIVYAEEALRRGRDIGDVRAEARAHEYIGAARNELGQHRDAIAECREGLRLASGAGYHFAAASTMLVLAAAHRANGEPRAALRHAELALSTVRERGELLLEADALSEAAQARFDIGDRETADRLVREAIRLAAQRGQRLVEARARLVLDRVGDQATSRLVRH